MMMNSAVKLDLFRTNVAAKKRNTDLAFLMGGADMLQSNDEQLKAWYLAERGLILNQLPSTAAPTPTPTPTTPSSPSDDACLHDAQQHISRVDAAQHRSSSDTAEPAHADSADAGGRPRRVMRCARVQNWGVLFFVCRTIYPIAELWPVIAGLVASFVSGNDHV